MQPAKQFTDLVVWQKAHVLVKEIYEYSAGFPKSELYGLTSQMRRAAVSVPANIAEGFKKRGKADKHRFLNISQGSLEETRYYLILAKDLGFGDSSPLMQILKDVSKLLEAYSSKIRNSIK